MYNDVAVVYFFKLVVVVYRCKNCMSHLIKTWQIVA